MFRLSLCRSGVYVRPGMKAITRYIFGQLVTATVAIALGLTFAVWLSQSLRLVDFIVNRGLPATTFLALIGLLLPSFIGIVLPIAAFCAVLFIYHKLIMDSELVVLRAAGFSQLRLARPALLLGLFTMLALYGISLYLLPASFRTFKDLQNQIRNDYASVLLQEGTFNSITPNLTVYVRERGAEGELQGILVHDTRDKTRPVTMMAERGMLVHSTEGPRVLMINGNRQQLDEDGHHLSVLNFDRYTVELNQLQETVHTRWREPKERYLGELLRHSSDSIDIANRNKLLAEAHHRIVGPLYAVTFILIALAALLSGEFNRRGSIRRVVAAVVCVAILEGLALGLQDLASRSAAFIPAMYAAAVLPGLVSLHLLNRRPRRRPAAATAQAVPAQ